MGASIKLSWLSLALLVLFQQDNIRTGAEFMPAINWSPRNPIFDCPSRGINTLLVKMGDDVSLVCPNMFGMTRTQNGRLNNFQYMENIFYVEPEKANDALTCNVTGYTPFLDCTKPTESYGEIFRIAEYSPVRAPLFHYGKLVYLIGTGDGTTQGLKNRVGGRCNTVETTPELTFKMILKVRACTYDEEHVYKNCTVCRTVGCYNYGCALYNSWQDWTYYRNVSQMIADGASPGYAKQLSEISQENQCIRRRRRTCSKVQIGCDGPSEEVENAPCPVVPAIPNYQNCTAWANVTGIYRNSTDRCFISNYRNCSVGNLEKMNIPQWKLSETVCPITTMAPTTTPCKAAANIDGNWTDWRDCQSSVYKFKCRECSNPAPQNNGKKCVGDWFKDMVCKKCDPSAGKRKASTGNSAGVDVMPWAIPIAGLIGIALGAFAMYLVIKHKQRVNHNHRDYSDSGSCGTVETRVMNGDCKLDMIKKPKTPEA